jgi:N-acetylneuraminic acid mutarotase
MKFDRRFLSSTLGVFIGTLALSAGNHVLAQDGSWTNEAPMHVNRYGLAAGVVSNIFYAVGGFNNETGLPMERTLEAYDPALNQWTTKTLMPTPRVYAAAASVNGKLYVMGGVDFVGHFFPVVEAYDPATDSWSTKSPMPGSRYGQATAVVNGIIYAMGGWDGGLVGRTHDLWAYDPATDTWTVKASMPSGRMSFGATVVENVIYAIGGEINGNISIGTVEAYDPATDTWTTKTPMPTHRLGVSAAELDGHIYAVGGRIGTTNLSTVEVYDPASDTWGSITPMPTPRAFVGTGVIGNTLYAAGGTVRNTGLATLEAFTLPAPPITVRIQVVPDRFDPRSHGRLIVIVFSTANFDAATIDPSTVRFGDTGTEAAPVHSSLWRVGRDPKLDLVLQFNIADTGFTRTSTTAFLTGKTHTGDSIEGSDTVHPTVRWH